MRPSAMALLALRIGVLAHFNRPKNRMSQIAFITHRNKLFSAGYVNSERIDPTVPSFTFLEMPHAF